jgi:hypothetical protein
LLASVSGHLAEKRGATARREVQWYPEVAWQLLRGPVPAADATALQAVAVAHDAQCVRAGEAAGWQALLADRGQRPAAYQRYAQRRAEFLANVRLGIQGRALTNTLAPPESDQLPKLIGIDAGQLTGTALILDGRPGEAAAAFRRAIELAEREYPYYEAQLRLQYSEALRHADRIAEADAAWVDAVRVARAGLSAQPPLLDPEYWQRVAYHRPVDRPWPPELLETLAGLAARYGLASDDALAVADSGRSASSDERHLWACIGHWHLERGEPQAALVALKRAHAMTAGPHDRQRLEWAQAKALMALDQPAAATTLLVAICDSSDPQMRCAALATLGSLRLTTGSTKQGYQLLHRALEQAEAVDWPSRAQAEADFGLAQLLLGNESAGLDWLHRAQARFDAAGAHEDLMQSLENELSYVEQAQKKHEAQALRQRIERLQR